jgi:hypothetical protein
MPSSFKESYPNTRVIIDCTEVFIEMHSQPRSQSENFSKYKNHNTGKGLIGISPRGAWPEIQDMSPQYISAVFLMKSYSYLTNASFN